MLFPWTWELRNRTWLYCQLAPEGLGQLNSHSIVVEQSTCKCDLTENPTLSAKLLPGSIDILLEILNPLSILLERHGSGIVDEDDYIEETDLD
jgi:hypothetical protein